MKRGLGTQVSFAHFFFRRRHEELLRLQREAEERRREYARLKAEEDELLKETFRVSSSESALGTSPNLPLPPHLMYAMSSDPLVTHPRFGRHLFDFSLTPQGYNTVSTESYYDPFGVRQQGIHLLIIF